MPIINVPTLGIKRITTGLLARLNLLVGGLYLLEIIGLFAWRRSANGVGIQTNFLSKDELASQLNGHAVLAEASRHLFNLNLVYLLGLALFILAAGHLLSATQLRKRYEKDLKNGRNRMRWQSYGLSFGLLSAAAGTFIGFRQVVLVIIPFLAAGLLCFLASHHELSSTKKTRSLWREPTSLVVAIIPSLLMLAYLIGAYMYGTPPTSYRYAAYVFWLIYAYALLRISLGTKLSSKDYLRLDGVYLVLTFLAFSALTWLIAAGLN